MKLIHKVVVDGPADRWFGRCLICGWTGPERYWRLLAKRDANRHILRSDA